MDRALSFEVQKRLKDGDLGNEVDEGFFMADLGGGAPAPGPSVTAPAHSGIRPKTRAERIKLADSMAARLMDQYMKPEALNDPNVLNPLRDGIPQCSAHPFTRGSQTEIGCVHGCGSQERQGSAGVLPVERDVSVADVWAWVRALVRLAVERADHRAGFTR